MSPATSEASKPKSVSSGGTASEVATSNNDANWVEENNADRQSDVVDPTIEIELANKSEKPTDTEKVATSGNDENWVKEHNGVSEPADENGSAEAPPLPEEAVPPLPNEAPPAGVLEDDDGWAPVWEETAQAFYFYNRFTSATQWENPRVPTAVTQPGPPGVDSPKIHKPEADDIPAASRPGGGYDPAIHGDYDPEAWYAKLGKSSDEANDRPAGTDPAATYAAAGAFNRFTGRWQNAELTPENFNDENKSKRQMNAFFDVDAAANSHDGRSLKAERSGKKISKNELKQFKEKRKAKKEEKRRAWLRD